MRAAHFLTLPRKQIEWSQRQRQASAFKALSSVAHLYHSASTALAHPSSAASLISTTEFKHTL